MQVTDIKFQYFKLFLYNFEEHEALKGIQEVINYVSNVVELFHQPLFIRYLIPFSLLQLQLLFVDV